MSERCMDADCPDAGIGVEHGHNAKPPARRYLVSHRILDRLVNWLASKLTPLDSENESSTDPTEREEG